MVSKWSKLVDRANSTNEIIVEWAGHVTPQTETVVYLSNINRDATENLKVPNIYLKHCKDHM